MSAPQTRCPSCSGILQPAPDRPGSLQCTNCRAYYAPQVDRPVLDVLGSVFVTIGKIVLILAGLVAVAFGVLFAGCLFSGMRIGG